MIVASTAEWASVASAGAAAVAAGASWASVRQTRKLWLIERAPDLQMIALVDRDSNRVTLQLHNAGGGFARDVVVYLVEGTRYFIAYAPMNGVIRPGQGVEIQTPLVKEPPINGPLVGAVIAADVTGTTHAWSASGTRHRRWTRKKLPKKPMSNNEIFSVIVPDANLDELDATSATGWRELK
jgi:hypothetical protein